MSAIKKVCINSSKNFYMGTELSPLHYGLSAEGYDINSIMEGYDKELWIVDVKNNKKVWVKNENLYRITHEEPVIKNILSLYCDAEDIEKVKQLKEMCGKDGSYNLKDIKKFYNVCDDDCDNEADESEKKKNCTGAVEEEMGNGVTVAAVAGGIASTEAATEVLTFLNNEEKREDNLSNNNIVSIGAKPVAGCNVCDENYEINVEAKDILKGAKGGKGGKGGKRNPGTITKANKVKVSGDTDKSAVADIKGEKEDANDDNKKPTDYNIFVKFRLNELKDINTNKKDNFENVKIEWRELKKNKGDLKIVMEKAYSWLNKSK